MSYLQELGDAGDDFDAAAISFLNGTTFVPALKPFALVFGGAAGALDERDFASEAEAKQAFAKILLAPGSVRRAGVFAQDGYKWSERVSRVGITPMFSMPTPVIAVLAAVSGITLLWLLTKGKKR